MAENWTKLAEAIGMSLDASDGPPYWHNNGEGCVYHDELPAYLMEPAQTARILALDGLPGTAWLIEREPDGQLSVARITQHWAAGDIVGDVDYVTAPTIGEAVARCAAGLLEDEAGE